MSAPAAPIDLVNLALLQLYRATITSLTDANDDAATAASRLYDYRRRAVLRNFVWNFVRTRATAPLVGGKTPAFDYQAFYQLPLDCLRVYWVGSDWNRFDSFQYDIQGRYLLLNPTDPAWAVAPPASGQFPSVNLEYGRDETDVTLFDPLFVDVLVLDLAVNLCMPITGDRTLLGDLRVRLKEATAEAVAINHQERPVIVTNRDPIADARLEMSDPANDVRVQWPTS